MKKFRLFNLLFLFLSISSLSFGQIEIKWKDVKVSGQTLVVNVFAQNLGQGFEFWNIYRGGKDVANIYLEYDLLRENRRIKLLPKTVLIETIFGTKIEMDSPIYYFPSTGSSSGQSWEIIFGLPYDAGNAIVTVFGKKLSLEDSKTAIEIKKELEREFLNNVKDKHWACEYKRYKFEEWNELKKKIETALWEEKKLHKKKPITGTITYHVNPHGDNFFHCEMADSKYNELIKTILGSFKLNRVNQYGWFVNSKAKFNISVAKGKRKGYPDIGIVDVFKSNNNMDMEFENSESTTIDSNESINNRKKEIKDNEIKYRYVYYKTLVNLNLRSKPNIDSNVLTMIPKDGYLYSNAKDVKQTESLDSFEINGEMITSCWIYVHYDTYEGWVFKGGIEKAGQH